MPTTVPAPVTDVPQTTIGELPAGPWTVVDVVDGDTLDVNGAEGATATVRVIGIDAPERGACFASEASDGLRFFAPPGAEVQLVADSSEVDSFGRFLRYVEVVAPDGTVLDVGAELVGLGFAIAREYPPDTARAHIYELRQIDSQLSGRGQWEPDRCPAPTTTAAVPAPLAPPPAIVPFATIPAASDCHPSYPDVCIPGGPDLDCGQITERRFRVLSPDPHGFDGDDDDGIGCESD